VRLVVKDRTGKLVLHREYTVTAAAIDACVVWKSAADFAIVLYDFGDRTSYLDWIKSGPERRGDVREIATLRFRYQDANQEFVEAAVPDSVRSSIMEKR